MIAASFTSSESPARPFYETAADLVRERAFADTLEVAWNVDMRKLPVKYRLDFLALRDGRPVALVECKERTTKSAKYEMYILSMHKFLRARLYSQTFRLPAILAVRFVDSDLCVSLEEGHGWALGFIDRHLSTRIDDADLEPVVHLPMEEFTGIDGYNKLI